jgi:hypothetical protein
VQRLPSYIPGCHSCRRGDSNLASAAAATGQLLHSFAQEVAFACPSISSEKHVFTVQDHLQDVLLLFA